MYQIEIVRLIIFIIVELICFFFVWKFLYTGIQKMYYVFSVAGITIYSGLSTVYKGVCDNYFIPYLIFYLVYSISFVIGIRIKLKIGEGKIKVTYRKKNFERMNYIQEKNQREIRSDWLIICVFLFFSYYLVQLIYPEIRLSELFNISLSIGDIFTRRELLRGNFVYQIFYYVNLLTISIFFIYIYKKKIEGKWKSSVGLFLLWYYLQVVVLGYISRNEMFIVCVFLLILITNRKRKEIEINSRFIIIGICLFILLIPFLNAYEMIRLGASSQKIGVLESIQELLEKETNYGQYYQFCVNQSKFSLFFRYIIWLITLPLPSIVFGSIKNYGLATNEYFTVAFTGIQPGSSNYSVILPSIFGEALMFFGQNFFWIHAVFLGFFFGKFCTKMEINNNLKLLNLYFAVSMLILGRGGSQAVMPSMINYMVMYFIVMKLLPKEKETSLL